MNLNTFSDNSHIFFIKENRYCKRCDTGISHANLESDKEGKNDTCQKYKRKGQRTAVWSNRDAWMVPHSSPNQWMQDFSWYVLSEVESFSFTRATCPISSIPSSRDNPYSTGLSPRHHQLHRTSCICVGAPTHQVTFKIFTHVVGCFKNIIKNFVREIFKFK